MPIGQNPGWYCNDCTDMALNPNQGGGKWPAGNLNAYFSATECPIDLKPSCIFKFVHYLDGYKKKRSIWTLRMYFFRKCKHSLAESRKSPCPTLQGPSKVQIGKFFYRPRDNGQTWKYSLVWGQSDIRLRRNNRLDLLWAIWPPPPYD